MPADSCGQQIGQFLMNTFIRHIERNTRNTQKTVHKYTKPSTQKEKTEKQSISVLYRVGNIKIGVLDALRFFFHLQMTKATSAINMSYSIYIEFLRMT